jgi:hypothetical protein
MTRLGCKDDNEYQQHFSRALFTLLLRYDALEGAGLQSAIPPHVFGWLHSRYGCNWECFASPFNCWLEDQQDSFLGGKYGSAFGDTDSVFNSAGSFFNVDFLAMAKTNGGGCFQANPPFASNFIDLMCSRMHQFLSNGNSDDGSLGENYVDIPIMFIIFVPAWKESHGWKALESSPYLTKHILLLREEDEHYYAEGTQHRRRVDNSNSKVNSDNHGSHRIASFDTSVFFLQNEAAKSQWQLSDGDECKLKLAFAMKLQLDGKNNNIMQQQMRKKTDSDKTTKSNASFRATEKRKFINIPPKAKKDKVVKKKPKLLEGGNDEMNILDSLGLVEDSLLKKRVNPSDTGTNTQRKKSKNRSRNKY